MPNHAHGLRAITIATLVAIAGATAAVAPVAATDPVATPSPAPTADPSATSSDSPSPTADPSVASPVTVGATATVVVPTPVVRPNLAARVVRIALNQRGDPYVRGRQGPNAFDCSGLVRYSYRKAGMNAKLGGGSSARGMLRWGRLHHLTGRTNPRIGDVVIYGNGSHAAIYIGRGRVIQALNPRLDIRVTRLHAVTTRFTTFIHTRLPTGG